MTIIRLVPRLRPTVCGGQHIEHRFKIWRSRDNQYQLDMLHDEPCKRGLRGLDLYVLVCWIFLPSDRLSCSLVVGLWFFSLFCTWFRTMIYHWDPSFPQQLWLPGFYVTYQIASLTAPLLGLLFQVQSLRHQSNSLGNHLIELLDVDCPQLGKQLVRKAGCEEYLMQCFYFMLVGQAWVRGPSFALCIASYILYGI